MGLRPTYMDETHLEWMSFDGVGHIPPGTHKSPYRLNEPYERGCPMRGDVKKEVFSPSLRER